MSLEIPTLRAGVLVKRALSFLQTDHALVERCLIEAAGLLGVADPEQSPGTQAFRATLARWQSQRVLAYIEDNLGTKLTTAILARLLPLSTGHFSRAFHRTVGCPPMSYIALKRIEHAQRLMQSSRQPMCTIALTCGFADQSHFSRTFRRWVGLSPGAWRRIHGRGTTLAAVEGVKSVPLDTFTFSPSPR